MMQYYLSILATSLLMFSPLTAYSQTFSAGIARINITPNTPIRMSGYGNRTEPFGGVHDSIYATAIALQQGDDKAVIVGADVVGFSHAFVDQVKQLIQDRIKISASHIQIIAAHNHGGPVTSVYTDNSTPAEITYYEVLQNKMVEVTIRAMTRLQPARIGAGKGACTMNINRRARHAEGGIWLGRNPEGPCDHEVGMIRFDDLQGKPFAAFLNWPCHATVSGQDNQRITGDWPGAVASYFHQRSGSSVLVTAGASADINPIYGPNSRYRDILAIGQILGDEALKVFEQIETYAPRGIKALEETIIADGKKRSDSRMPNVSLQRGPDENIRVSLLKIGPIVLTGISGELMTEIGYYIKDVSPYRNTFVVTHCNGSNGYLCTDLAYQEGGYEPMVSRTMPGTEAKIKEVCKKLLFSL